MISIPSGDKPSSVQRRTADFDLGRVMIHYSRIWMKEGISSFIILSLLFVILMPSELLAAVSGYYAPYKGGSSIPVTQGNNGTTSHYGSGGAYAIDFGGRFDVYAPKDGTVDIVGTDSAKIQFCKDNPQYWHGNANYVRIKHSDGVYSYYYHLESVSVKKGDSVVRGVTKIGISGNTGCSTNSHLHFQLANTASMSRANSLKVYFDDIGDPAQGASYTSKNYPLPSIEVKEFWLKSGAITVGGTFDAQFKLYNPTSQPITYKDVALSIHKTLDSAPFDLYRLNGAPLTIYAGQTVGQGGSQVSLGQTGFWGKTTIPMLVNGQLWGAGNYLVVAKILDNTGAWRVLGQQPLTITDAPVKTLSSVSVSCPSSIDESRTGTCTATARFSDNSTSTSGMQWSGSTSYATVNSTGGITAGNVNSNQIMTVTATHTFGGISRSGSATVTIRDVPPPVVPASIASISANPQTIKVNKSITFSATINQPSDVNRVELAFADANVVISMSQISSNVWTMTRAMSGIGTNRPYTVRVFRKSGGTAEKSGTYTVNR